MSQYTKITIDTPIGKAVVTINGLNTVSIMSEGHHINVPSEHSKSWTINGVRYFGSLHLRKDEGGNWLPIHQMHLYRTDQLTSGKEPSNIARRKANATLAMAWSDIADQYKQDAKNAEIINLDTQLASKRREAHDALNKLNEINVEIEQLAQKKERLRKHSPAIEPFR